MTGGPLMNLGELSRPATVLIEKVSDAIGGIAKPWQMRRTARAEVDVDNIKSVGKRALSELEARALDRLIVEEARKQENIESITKKSINHLHENSSPEEISDDWIANFFDKCRNVSEDEMQEVWGRILAEKSNSGGFSRRSLEIVSSMEREDALAFSRLCNMVVFLGGVITPIIFHDKMDNILIKNNLNFTKLQDLEALDLIFFDTVSGFLFKEISGVMRLFYHDKGVEYKLGNAKVNFSFGNVRLTKYGQEIFSICDKEYDDEYFKFVVEKLGKDSSCEHLAIDKVNYYKAAHKAFYW